MFHFAMFLVQGGVLGPRWGAVLWEAFSLGAFSLTKAISCLDSLDCVPRDTDIACYVFMHVCEVDLCVLACACLCACPPTQGVMGSHGLAWFQSFPTCTLALERQATRYAYVHACEILARKDASPCSIGLALVCILATAIPLHRTPRNLSHFEHVQVLASFESTQVSYRCCRGAFAFIVPN